MSPDMGVAFSDDCGKVELMKMPGRLHPIRCTYGCCGAPPKQKFLGAHASQTKTVMARRLKKKDRREGKREISREIG